MDLFTIAGDAQRALDAMKAMERWRIGVTCYRDQWFLSDTLRGKDLDYVELCLVGFARPIEAVERAAQHFERKEP